MKHLFFLFLCLAYSQLACSQLPDDSLKKICTHQYEIDIRAGNDTDLHENLDKRTVEESATELFRDYFDNIKIYLVNWEYKTNVKKNTIDYSNRVYNRYPRLYACNMNTGKMVNFKNDAAFFKMINSARQEICDIDKCFLYLFLFGRKSYGVIVAPSSYELELNKNSVFLDVAFAFFNYSEFAEYRDAYHDELIDWLAVTRDVTRSNRNSIYIYYVQKHPSRHELTICRYQFTFDNKNRLLSVLTKLKVKHIQDKDIRPDASYWTE